MKRQPENKHLGYDDTPLLPKGYHVHDGTRPQPGVVTPGVSGGAPSDAIFVWDGKTLDQWESAKEGPAQWDVSNGVLTVRPKTGDIQTREVFGSMQLHLEFASPTEVKGNSQGRGNSGVFLMGLYEIQVLDCYQNPTYADGTVGGVYGQYPPLVNAIRPPGEWNTYDIIWEAPVLNGVQVVRKAAVTVLLNGIVLHHRRKLLGITGHKDIYTYPPHDAKLPLKLQDHGDLVRFRNIWIREIGEYDG
jgi:hypothetical protein